MILATVPITQVGYRPYGDILSADRADVAAKDANQGTAARKDWQIDVESRRPSARANFTSFRVEPRCDWPMPIVLLEKHPHSTQTFVPMGTARYLVVVALGGDAPDLATLRAFVVHPGTAVSYRPGVWHHPMIGLDAVSDFACLVWEDGTADDAVVFSLADRGVNIPYPATETAP